MITKISIPGIIPSKKNSRNLFFKKGRIFNIPSKRYADWHKQHLKNVEKSGEIHDVSEIIIKFYFPDKRRRDLTNLAESILDLLVDAKVLKDDSWEYTGDITLRSAGVVKHMPGVLILIHHSVTPFLRQRCTCSHF